MEYGTYLRKGWGKGSRYIYTINDDLPSHMDSIQHTARQSQKMVAMLNKEVKKVAAYIQSNSGTEGKDISIQMDLLHTVYTTIYIIGSRKQVNSSVVDYVIRKFIDFFDYAGGVLGVFTVQPCYRKYRKLLGSLQWIVGGLYDEDYEIDHAMIENNQKPDGILQVIEDVVKNVDPNRYCLFIGADRSDIKNVYGISDTQPDAHQVEPKRRKMTDKRYKDVIKLWTLLCIAAKIEKEFTYKQINELLNIRSNNAVRFYLSPIMCYCYVKEYPPLTILVVNQAKRVPGGGLVLSTYRNMTPGEQKNMVFQKKDWWIHLPLPDKEDFEKAEGQFFP